MTPAEQQRTTALATANAVRCDSAAVKREIRDGLLSVTTALYDLRAGVLHVDALLGSQRGWGRYRIGCVCNRSGVPAHKRVRDLTDRQREALAREVMRRT